MKGTIVNIIKGSKVKSGFFPSVEESPFFPGLLFLCGETSLNVSVPALTSLTHFSLEG